MRWGGARRGWRRCQSCRAGRFSLALPRARPPASRHGRAPLAHEPAFTRPARVGSGDAPGTARQTSESSSSGGVVFMRTHSAAHAAWSGAPSAAGSWWSSKVLAPLTAATSSTSALLPRCSRNARRAARPATARAARAPARRPPRRRAWSRAARAGRRRRQLLDHRRRIIAQGIQAHHFAGHRPWRATCI